MRIVVVLPEPFGPEEAEDRSARHGQVEGVDGDLAAAEPLGQARVTIAESPEGGAAPTGAPASACTTVTWCPPPW